MIPPLLQIPSLNHVPLHHLPEGTLVRYRAMVQDQFDPEFYLKVYHSRHKQTNTEVIKVVAKIGSDFIFNCMCFVVAV